MPCAVAYSEYTVLQSEICSRFSHGSEVLENREDGGTRRTRMVTGYKEKVDVKRKNDESNPYALCCGLFRVYCLTERDLL